MIRERLNKGKFCKGLNFGLIPTMRIKLSDKGVGARGIWVIPGSKLPSDISFAGDFHDRGWPGVGGPSGPESPIKGDVWGSEETP